MFKFARNPILHVWTSAVLIARERRRPTAEVDVVLLDQAKGQSQSQGLPHSRHRTSGSVERPPRVDWRPKTRLVLWSRQGEEDCAVRFVRLPIVWERNRKELLAFEEWRQVAGRLLHVCQRIWWVVQQAPQSSSWESRANRESFIQSLPNLPRRVEQALRKGNPSPHVENKRGDALLLLIYRAVEMRVDQPLESGDSLPDIRGPDSWTSDRVHFV